MLKPEALKPVDEVVAEKSEEDEAEEATETTEEEVEVEEAEEEATEEVAEEDIVEEEPIVEKGESKAEPIHDVIAEKAKPKSIYEIMGRNADGTRRK